MSMAQHTQVRTHLSEFDRGQIIGMHRGEISTREIARMLCCNQSTVVRVINRWLREGTHTRRTGSGRPRSTNDRDDRHIVRLAIQSRRATIPQIRDMAILASDQTLSNSTVRRRLHEAGLSSCRPLLRLPLTPHHRARRLEWCRSRTLWDHEWNSVLFSDESRFNLGGNDGRRRVWRRVGERANPDCISERHTSQTPGIMVWGGILYGSRTPLVFIPGTLNSVRYVNDVMIPVVQPFIEQHPGTIFQQDNATPHVARVSMECLSNIETLPWPARSPDLSPIENIWDMMGRRLSNSLHSATNLNELRNQLETAWQDIPQEHIDHTIRSMPNRISQCIASRGGHTSY